MPKLKYSMNVKWDYSSANFSLRHETKIDTILLHHTGGTAPGCIEWLCNPTAKVSAHHCITKDGVIHELVDVYKCAWHAGRGAFDINNDGEISDEEKSFNRRSIGVEIESLGQTYTDLQLMATVDLCYFLCKHFDIPPANILGHKEIASQRKWDPGHFEMNDFREAIKQLRSVRGKP
jgi:N-acetylmuramoyl-L-alanine amidase